MSGLLAFYAQTFPPPSKFTVDDIPDLTGKVIIVTGGNSGIGYETAKALLSRNAKVYIASRSRDKAAEAIISLAESTGKTAAGFLEMDLANLKSIKASVEDFLRNESELHVLFNSAGVMFPEPEVLSADGYDLSFATNVLGHFYLTKLLLPLLIQTAQIYPDFKARIINTSSIAAAGIGSINYNTLTDTAERRKADMDTIYNQSKLGNIMFANELARRYGDNGIVSTSLHPGLIRTDLQRTLKGPRRFIVNRLLQPTPFGALTPLYAGVSADSATFNGKYFVPWARECTAPPASKDQRLCTELWDWMERQVQNV
ncbi:hypothetical protein C8J56DRAFT_1161565 [Mycena floridula]|nr:hypothetical protein C8J56DRAFT_1161565 [Mycena floridula]